MGNSSRQCIQRSVLTRNEGTKCARVVVALREGTTDGTQVCRCQTVQPVGSADRGRRMRNVHDTMYDTRFSQASTSVSASDMTLLPIPKSLSSVRPRRAFRFGTPVLPRHTSHLHKTWRIVRVWWLPKHSCIHAVRHHRLTTEGSPSGPQVDSNGLQGQGVAVAGRLRI